MSAFLHCKKHDQGYPLAGSCSACAAETTFGPVVPLPEPEILTVEEGAEFLRISRTTLYDAIGRGEVPHRRIGRQIRLHKNALVRWLSGDRVEHQK